MGKLTTLIYLIGAYKVTKPLVDCAQYSYNSYFRPDQEKIDNDQRIQKIYGSNDGNRKWAMITGGSEGIGRQFCLDFARAGFNIAISSRSLDKLEKVKQEIQAIDPKVEVRCKAIDYSSETDYSSIISDSEVVNNLAFIVNNVGFLKL